jgi:predicted Na+-dependent transporter
MKNITLSWTSEIPKIIKNIRDSIIYAIGASLPFAAIISHKLNITVEEFSAGCGIGIVAAKFIAKIFGVPEDDQKSIKIDASNN